VFLGKELGDRPESRVSRDTVRECKEAATRNHAAQNVKIIETSSYVS
jgi:hypothetical protein